MTLSFRNIEKLSRYSYAENHQRFMKWVEGQEVDKFTIRYTPDNCRVSFIKKDKTIYIAISEMNDKASSKNCNQLKTIKRLCYGFKQYAIPASGVIVHLCNWVNSLSLELDEYKIVIVGDLKGAAIGSNVFAQLLEMEFTNIYGWFFRNPGGGSVKFRKIVHKMNKNPNVVNFEIKRKIHWTNIFTRNIGITIKAPTSTCKGINDFEPFFKTNEDGIFLKQYGNYMSKFSILKSVFNKREIKEYAKII